MYIAGVWQSDLVNDLLWYTDGSSPRRMDDLHAPTWSWACVNSVVKHLPATELFGNFVTIIDAQASASDSTSHESGTKSYLKLRGYLLQILPGNFSIDTILPDRCHDMTEVHHFYLPLRLQKTVNSEHLCGLVIRLVEKAFTPTYERIGLFRFDEGDEVRIAGHQNFRHAHVLTKNPGDVVSTMSLTNDIIIF